MKPQLIIVILAVLAVVLTALPLGEGETGSSRSWPCCDDCGACNRKFPPECQCNDISANGCHSECKKCVRNIGSVENHAGGGPGPVVIFRCADTLTNFCKRRCTPPPAAAFLGVV